jgi:branched-chain amino acid transport system substrate-binding protein
MGGKTMNMKQHLIVLATASLAATATLLVTADKAAATDYQILVIQAKTGNAAFVGVPALRGIELAADEINASGYMGSGNKLKLIIEDDASDRNQVFTLMNRYVKGDPNTLAIIGPTGGSTSIPAAGLGQEMKIPTYTLTSGDGPLKAGPYAFMSSQSANAATPVLARYALDKLGAKRCSIIFADDNDSYVTAEKVFVDTFAAGGGQIVDTVHVKLADADYSAAATRIASQKIDCVWVGSHGPQSANIVRQLKQAGLDPSVNVLGSIAFVSGEFVQLGGKAVEGAYSLAEWVPGSDAALVKKFVESYNKKFTEPLDNWAPVGYTMVYVIANAIKSAGDKVTRESVRDALAKTKDFPVIMGSGSYTINPETRQVNYGAQIVKIEGGKFIPIK